ncbi:MAG: molecular chaperone DnaJ [Candidatus Dormibacteria bacterium]
MAVKRAEMVAIESAALLLGVRSGASVDEVVTARRLQAKVWHPDVNPTTGSAERMGLINSACDLLCDFIRRGGYVRGLKEKRTSAPRAAQARNAAPRVFDVRFEPGVSIAISAPDRLARVDLDALDAADGGLVTVRFVRNEPGRCATCAGLGAAPGGPKRVCPDCAGGAARTCPGCDGRGWIHLNPGSCPRCAGSGAGLVECSIRLRLPGGILEQRRAFVPGWGDLGEDGQAGNLWVDLVPVSTSVRSGAWRFAYFGHDWPRPTHRVDGDWLTVTNLPLPDDEMRDLGFWRDPKSDEWVRQAPSSGADFILEMIVQRQFFVPGVPTAS